MLEKVIKMWCPVRDMDIEDSIRAKALEDCISVNKVCALCPQSLDIIKTTLKYKLHAIAECNS